MIRVVAPVLAVVCQRMQQLPTMLGPALQSGKDTTHKTFETMCNAHAWPQQCSKSCANRSNIVALRFGDSRNKRNVGSCWLKILTGVKLCATTRNNIQQGVQTDATMLGVANNIASVCTGLYRPIFRSGHRKCIVLTLVKRDIQRKKR